jgi:hypothetical protein
MMCWLSDVFIVVFISVYLQLNAVFIGELDVYFFCIEDLSFGFNLYFLLLLLLLILFAFD